jgi:hypothetical protein
MAAVQPEPWLGALITTTNNNNNNNNTNTTSDIAHCLWYIRHIRLSECLLYSLPVSHKTINSFAMFASL